MSTTFATKTATAAVPVVKNAAIGEIGRGLLVKAPEQRDKMKDGKKIPKFKDGEPVLKNDGTPAYVQELIVTYMVLDGSTNTAGSKGEYAPVVPGQVVRMILSGGGYGAWIEAQKEFGGQLGTDTLIETICTHAQAYQTTGAKTAPVGGKITDQAAANAVPRNQTLGYYSSIKLSQADASLAAEIAKADEIATAAPAASTSASAAAVANGDDDDFV